MIPHFWINERAERLLREVFYTYRDTPEARRAKFKAAIVEALTEAVNLGADDALNSTR